VHETYDLQFMHLFIDKNKNYSMEKILAF